MRRAKASGGAIAFAVAAVVLGAGCRREPVIVVRFEALDGGAQRDAARPIDLAADLRAPGPAGAIDRATVRCVRDGDCVVVKGDCCGCAAGGTAMALARSAAKAHEALQAKSCVDVMCAQSISTDASCGKVAVCREGRCVLALPRANR